MFRLLRTLTLLAGTLLVGTTLASAELMRLRYPIEPITFCRSITHIHNILHHWEYHGETAAAETMRYLMQRRQCRTIPRVIPQRSAVAGPAIALDAQYGVPVQATPYWTVVTGRVLYFINVE